MATRTGEQHQSFDADDYLRKQYSDVNNPDRVLFRLESFHKAFQRLPSSLKALDYGSGPAILTVISAAARASEIVLSDVAESNLQALRKWLEHDPTAFNWSPFFDHVVQKLEGKSEEEAREREERVRQVVKDVVHCDIDNDPPISKGFEGPYDVVIDSGCLAAACTTTESYNVGVAKLASLLKPGGTPIIFTSQREKTGAYTVGSKIYNVLALNGEYVTKVLQDKGFSEIIVNLYRFERCNPRDESDITVGYLFITAKKNY